jgi:hypothetical protein
VITRNGSVVSRDRAELIREVRFWYGDDMADQVVFASLPSDERLHVEQARAKANRAEDDKT